MKEILIVHLVPSKQCRSDQCLCKIPYKFHNYLLKCFMPVIVLWTSFASSLRYIVQNN